MDEQTFGFEFTKQGWDTEIPFYDPPIPGQLIMAMMTGHGDIKKVWNAANADEVEDARRSFNHLVKDKGYMAFKVNPDGSNGNQIREFDPTAGKLILVPAVAGGR